MDGVLAGSLGKKSWQGVFVGSPGREPCQKILARSLDKKSFIGGGSEPLQNVLAMSLGREP